MLFRSNPAPLNEYDIVPVHLNFMDSADGKMVYYTLKDQYMLSEPIPLEKMFWHGEIPIVVGKCLIDTHNPMPESLIDLGRQLQTETNEVSNQRLDNVKLVLNKRYFVRRNSNVDTESLLRNVPGGVTMVGNTASDGGDVREVNWQDVTSSSYQEQDRINVDYDDLTGGGLNSGSVMTNRKLNETVGGMKIMAQGANNLTEYTIRVFVETWVEPQLRLLMKCEQYYESDQTILAVAGKKAAPLMQKFGMDQVTDWLLINDLTLNVNVGMGATDPDARFQHFMQATGAFLQMVPNLPPDANIEEIRNELFGLAGYRDGARFFSGQGDPRIKHLMEQLENASKQVEQLKMQVQHGLAFEKEKRAIDQRKAQVDLEGIRMQAQGQDPMAEHMLEIQKLRMEAAEAQQKLELERQEAEAELQLKRGTAEAELALERARLAAEIQLEREKLQAELTLQRQKTSAEMQIKASTAERDSETKARAAESEIGRAHV